MVPFGGGVIERRIFEKAHFAGKLVWILELLLSTAQLVSHPTVGSELLTNISMR